jgi:hypothetical protein
VFLAVALVFAPGAAAKGPHAILTTPAGIVQPGKPWEFTVELNEFRHPPKPAMVARRGSHTVGARVKRTPASIPGAAGFRMTLTLPSEGRWRLRMRAGNRRFAFPAVHVGGTRAPVDYVAFPVGSDIPSGPADFSPSDQPIEPDEPAEHVAAAPEASGADDGGGIGPWALPLLGVVLAGAGVAAVTRRGAR